MMYSNKLYIPFTIKPEKDIILDMRMSGMKNRKACKLYLCDTNINKTNYSEHKLQLHNEYTFIILKSNYSGKQFGKLCIRRDKVEIIDYNNYCNQETKLFLNDLKIATFTSPYLPFIGKDTNDGELH